MIESVFTWTVSGSRKAIAIASIFVSSEAMKRDLKFKHHHRGWFLNRISTFEVSGKEELVKELARAVAAWEFNNIDISVEEE